MTDKKANKEDLERVEKQDKKNEDFQVREGEEDSSMWGDKVHPDENAYPRKSESDKQFNDQPEFTQPYGNESKDSDNDKV